MLNVGCLMCKVACGMTMRVAFIKKTPISRMRTDGSFHRFFTLAPRPAALAFDAPLARRMGTDSFACGVGVIMLSVECGMGFMLRVEWPCGLVGFVMLNVECGMLNGGNG